MQFAVSTCISTQWTQANIWHEPCSLARQCFCFSIQVNVTSRQSTPKFHPSLLSTLWIFLQTSAIVKSRCLGWQTTFFWSDCAECNLRAWWDIVMASLGWQGTHKYPINLRMALHIYTHTIVNCHGCLIITDP